MEDDYKQTSVTLWRMRELMQTEKDNVLLRARIAELEAEIAERDLLIKGLHDAVAGRLTPLLEILEEDV